MASYIEKAVFTETPEMKAKRLGVRVIPPKKPIKPIDTNPVTAICGECGVEIRTVMHMSCSSPNCPCFPNRSSL